MQTGAHAPTSIAAPNRIEAASLIRYELVEGIDATELDAMEQLLHLMYSQKVPGDASLEQLLQVLQLADRYQAKQCSELVMSYLMRQGPVKHDVTMQLLSMPPGLQQQPTFQELVTVCRDGGLATIASVTVIAHGQTPPTCCYLWKSCPAWKQPSRCTTCARSKKLRFASSWARCCKLWTENGTCVNSSSQFWALQVSIA